MSSSKLRDSTLSFLAYRILGNYVELQQRAHEYGCGSMSYVTLLSGRRHQAKLVSNEGRLKDGSQWILRSLLAVLESLCDRFARRRKVFGKPLIQQQASWAFGNQDGEWLQ